MDKLSSILSVKASLGPLMEVSISGGNIVLYLLLTVLIIIVFSLFGTKIAVDPFFMKSVISSLE